MKTRDLILGVILVLAGIGSKFLFENLFPATSGAPVLLSPIAIAAAGIVLLLGIGALLGV